MTISTLPTAPSRSMTPAAFIAAMDAWIAALAIMVAEINATAAGFGVTLWVSGTTYAQYALVYSPSNLQTYRRISAGAGTTDPASDATNWAPVNPRNTILARSSNTVLSGANHGAVVRATGSWTQTFDACASLGTGWAVQFINEGVGTITFDPNSSETISGQTTLAFGPGESGTIVCNGTNLQIVGRSRYAGAIASGRNIAGRTNSVTPLAKWDVTADELQLKDSNGNAFVATSVSVTADITVSGANGLDTGSENSSTWYYVWVIAKPDGTVASLLSTSSSAPTMPSGYTFKALVSAVRNNGSSNFIASRQFGSVIWFEGKQNVLSAGAATIETPVATSGFVPPIASEVLLAAYLNMNSTAGGFAAGTGTLRVVAGADSYALQAIGNFASDAARDTAQVRLPNIGQNVYYILSSAGSINQNQLTLDVMAFKLPMGGE